MLQIPNVLLIFSTYILIFIKNYLLPWNTICQTSYSLHTLEQLIITSSLKHRENFCTLPHIILRNSLLASRFWWSKVSTCRFKSNYRHHYYTFLSSNSPFTRSAGDIGMALKVYVNLEKLTDFWKRLKIEVLQIVQFVAFVVAVSTCLW